MGLLLANPISRGRDHRREDHHDGVLRERSSASSAFAGTMLGSMVGDMGLDVAERRRDLRPADARRAGRAAGWRSRSARRTGRKGAAVWGAVGFMVAMHVMNSLGEIAGNPAWQKLSPFYYYLGGDPLNNGLDWGTPQCWPRSRSC